MSKKIKQKNGLNEHLTKKQIIDIISLLIIFVAIYGIIEFTDIPRAILGGALVLLFCLAIIVFEATKKSFKKQTNIIIDELIEKTGEDAKKIEGITTIQKENINLSFTKISSCDGVLGNPSRMNPF